jgi:hypothetical protein
LAKLERMIVYYQFFNKSIIIYRSKMNAAANAAGFDGVGLLASI